MDESALSKRQARDCTCALRQTWARSKSLQPSGNVGARMAGAPKGWTLKTKSEPEIKQYLQGLLRALSHMLSTGNTALRPHWGGPRLLVPLKHLGEKSEENYLWGEKKKKNNFLLYINCQIHCRAPKHIESANVRRPDKNKNEQKQGKKSHRPSDSGITKQKLKPNGIY